MKTFTISIPKPCHADWNQMTPDEKGAFCGSCKKSVYDFTNKTDEQISEVFEQNPTAEICGRFDPSQLSRPLYTSTVTRPAPRLALFAYALLMIFGATLFNGVEVFGGNGAVKGDVKVKLGNARMVPAKPIPDKLEIRGEAQVDTIRSKENVKCSRSQSVKGDTIFEIPDTTSVVNYPPKEEKFSRLGQTVVTMETPPPVETLILISPYPKEDIGLPIVPKEILPVTDTIETKEPVMDMAERDSADAITTFNENLMITPKLELKATPNPSSGDIMLTYTLETKTMVRIELFDISGKLVKILSGQSPYYAGKYSVRYTIEDLPDGIYVAALTASGQKATAKIILAR